MKKPSHVHTGSGRCFAVFPLLVALMMDMSMLAIAEPPTEDPSKAPPQAWLLPMDIEKIQGTALAELLKLRPELKANDLKVSNLMYILTPDPDFEIQVQKDGTRKKLYLSSNYQQLSVTFLILHTAHDGKRENRPTIDHETVSVSFPNARSSNFSVAEGTSSQRR